MAEEKWEKVVDNIESVEWKWDEDKYKELIGVYIAKKEHVSVNDSNIYYVENKEGVFSFWGKTVLDALLKGIEIGKEIKVTHTGMKKPKKGGKPYFDFDVEHRKVAFTKITEEDIPEIDKGKDEINTKDIPF